MDSRSWPDIRVSRLSSLNSALKFSSRDRISMGSVSGSSRLATLFVWLRKDLEKRLTKNFYQINHFLFIISDKIELIIRWFNQNNYFLVLGQSIIFIQSLNNRFFKRTSNILAEIIVILGHLEKLMFYLLKQHNILLS
ncbi:hypothetical protein BpHYR1_030751 [Brachionus plicatilis]|uniref:Uncharacterized protein n=1 Tax=Brachionus plicatilis TaxID=10195 RepID=A0A3M7T8B4_BRAPC|nr:hypothetical protein BpHYR1_030751 [Brachionus plicatilis]